MMMMMMMMMMKMMLPMERRSFEPCSDLAERLTIACRAVSLMIVGGQIAGVG
jgi:hypothetical protein